jgi:mono/diheme cytochrome c family protein
MNRTTQVCFSFLAAGLGAAGCAGGDPTETNREFVPEMVDSIPYDSFAENPVTRDKKTLIAPVKGTIPRGFTPFHYGDSLEEAARAGRELESPISPSAENAARGEKVWKSFCVPCHGQGGLGDGPVIPRFPAPPSLLAKNALELPDGRIFHIITKGQGLMPAHGTQISAEDRWKVILHVRSLQKPASAGGKP